MATALDIPTDLPSIEASAAPYSVLIAPNLSLRAELDEASMAAAVAHAAGRFAHQEQLALALRSSAGADLKIYSLDTSRTIAALKAGAVPASSGARPDLLVTFSGEDLPCFAPGEPRFVFRIAGTSPLELSIELAYPGQLFEAWRMQSLLSSVALLVASIDSADQDLAAIPLVEAGQAAELAALGSCQRPYPHDLAVAEIFRARARETPQACAIAHGAKRVSYQLLDTISDGIAARLQAQGVAPGDRVAVLLDRSPEQIAAFVAILKCGAAYVPIEPSYPAERVGMMLQDSGARLTVSSSAHAAHAGALILLDREDLSGSPSLAQPDPGLPAYLMYTSGSTGAPKGALIPQRGITRLVFGSDYFDFGPSTRMLYAAPASFDASTLEIWGALLHGGSCVIYPSAIPVGWEVRGLLAAEGVTSMWLTASLFNSLVDEDPAIFSPLRELAIGGEALSVPHVRRALAALPALRLVNGYGPTECATFTCTQRIDSALAESGRSIPIGRPINATSLRIADRFGQLTPKGGIGELWIGGAGVADGYLNRPELSAERFVGDAGARFYRSGDLVRLLAGGELEYLGRIDQQIKISGFRIEPGEIEALLTAAPGVEQAAVVAATGRSGLKQLAAFVTPADGGSPDIAALARLLSERLPAHMLPRRISVLPALPLTGTGKIDRLKLAASSLAPDSRQLEAAILEIFRAILGDPSISADDNFFERGGSSLLAVRCVGEIAARTGLELSAVALFERPSARSLAAPASGASAAPLETGPTASAGDIAVVGMAIRAPGSGSVDELWQNLLAGREGVSFFAPGELDPELPGELVSKPAYVRARGIIAGAELFDADFFETNPAEAETIDPQQRVFLEICHEALELSGHDPASFPGEIGLFAGSYFNTYLSRSLAARPELAQRAGPFALMLANDKDYLATRVAHKLDLRGPAVTVQSACSTSLVAIAQAAASLASGQCDMALAGGVSMSLPVRSGYLYQEGGMLSPDGHCRPFDAKAQGTTFGDGAGVVVLRRLADALADGDTIYAVVKGAAVNNDGSCKASFTAPSAAGQYSVIKRAMSAAGVRPSQISFVEAHGTATPLGDPIEVEALARVFAEDPEIRPGSRSCALGSIKGNVGHLVIAAGVTGFIKAALALKERVLPPSLHFESPNPKIPFEDTPFFVNDSTLALAERDGASALYAGISSFGVGGTNAHVVLASPPEPAQAPAKRPVQIFLSSAKTADALALSARRLAARVQAGGQSAQLEDLAYTLAIGRKHHAQRAFAIGQDGPALAGALTRPFSAQASERAEMAWIFPGQGAQYAGMGGAIYRQEPAFREAFDRCADAARPILGADLRSVVFDPAYSQISETLYTQPALYAVECALAALWRSWGCEPALLLGHSLGELSAAAVAGIFSLEDGMRIVSVRAKLMSSLERGAMLSVKIPESGLNGMLEALCLAAVNTPGSSVLSGPLGAIESVEQELAGRKIAFKRLSTSHAFHSRMIEPMLAEFSRFLEGVQLGAPRVPIVSSVTGRLLSAAEASDPSYWSSQIRRTVRFHQAATSLIGMGRDRIFLELGPGNLLGSLLKQSGAGRELKIACSLGSEPEAAEPFALARALGECWCHGMRIDWSAYYGSGRIRRPLPTYPFERRRFWIDAPGKVSIEKVETRSMPQLQQSQSNPKVVSELVSIMEDISGLDLEGAGEASFLELGLDSLSLTQAASVINERFEVEIPFRRLLEDLATFGALAAFIGATLPPEPRAAAPEQPAAQPNAPIAQAATAAPTPAPALSAQPALASLTGLEAIAARQLEIMSQQLALLQAAGPGARETLPTRAATAPALGQAAPQPAAPVTQPAAPADEDKPRKSFGAGARITLERGGELTPKQSAYITDLIRRYSARSAESKRQAQKHRPYLADPRTVSGFRPLTKEITYPIVVDRSKGSRLWDVDGSEYLDLTCGFGSNFFGNLPDFVAEAVQAQLERGMEIGPQHPLAGEVAELICKLTGCERAAFASTGSEAVLGAMRLARTVTGRKTIVTFTGAYHGIFDEVIVRESRKKRAIPAAPGITQSAVDNVWVLEWGTPESLETIRKHAGELAAVMVEPVQSRRPGFQPAEFLRELRAITEASGSALIFDEIVTGFRVHPGGAQAHFGIQADLATYGKVVGGGMPIGVIAGRKRFMDAMDGGFWSFGDQSYPEAGVTYFAGTFVRHPLSLAAAKAVLTRLDSAGPELQQGVASLMQGMADRLNRFFDESRCGLSLPAFSSIGKLGLEADVPQPDLIYFLLREKGIHIWDGRPVFVTTAHTQEDADAVVRAFKASVKELQEQALLPGSYPAEVAGVLRADEPPVPGARLGRDPRGNPGWYVPDPARPGKFMLLAQDKVN